MNYVIIGLIILFWLDYRNLKKKIIHILEDLDKRVKKLELPSDFREHGKIWGTQPKKVEEQIKEALKKI